MGPIPIIEAQVVFSPIPKDFVAINQLMAQFEGDPRKTVALRNARKKLAESSKSEDGKLTLATLRLGRGMSQSVLAQKINTSQSRLSRIETGIDEIYFSTFEKLKTALNISRDELAVALQGSKRNR
jgi:ribosome-binding protein aMBF1 (putative translation factor)